jgi:hypothetical protein
MPHFCAFAEHLRFWIYYLNDQRCDGDGVPPITARLMAPTKRFGACRGFFASLLARQLSIVANGEHR